MKTTIKYIMGYILLVLIIASCSDDGEAITDPVEPVPTAITETFTFSSNGTAINGKIFLPASYDGNKNLPAIYLIDYTEQHFSIAKDEFEKVIDGVEQLQGFDALVVTLEEHPDIDSKPYKFQEYYDVFKDMAAYVDANYTENTSRTFIGRGSEGGIVMMALFLEDSETAMFDNFIATDSPASFNGVIVKMIEDNDFPQDKQNKKLHFSFSTSNNYGSCTTLINTFNDADYPWLQFESHHYSSTNYEDTYPTSFAAGIKYIFSE